MFSIIKFVFMFSLDMNGNLTKFGSSKYEWKRPPTEYDCTDWVENSNFITNKEV